MTNINMRLYTAASKLLIGLFSRGCDEYQQTSSYQWHYSLSSYAQCHCLIFNYLELQISTYKMFFSFSYTLQIIIPHPTIRHQNLSTKSFFWKSRLQTLQIMYFMPVNNEEVPILLTSKSMLLHGYWGPANGNLSYIKWMGLGYGYSFIADI